MYERGTKDFNNLNIENIQECVENMYKIDDDLNAIDEEYQNAQKELWEIYIRERNRVHQYISG